MKDFEMLNLGQRFVASPIGRKAFNLDRDGRFGTVN
jgi:hypothetical protein